MISSLLFKENSFEEIFINNITINKLNLIFDAILCTKASLNFINEIDIKNLKKILSDCKKIKSLKSNLLFNLSFTINTNCRSSMVKLKNSHNYVFVNKLESFGQSLSIYGGHEFITLNIMRLLVQNNDVYAEIGANYGDFLFIINDEIGYLGSSYGFEASITIFPYLKASVFVNKEENIKLENLVISDVNGILVFQITDSVGGYNSLSSAIKSDLILPYDYSSLYDVLNIEMQSVKLDNYFQNHNIAPNLVRLDIEGSECKVIRGLQYTINQHKLYFLVEFQGALMAKFESEDSIINCFNMFYNSAYIIIDIFSLQIINKEDLVYMYKELQDTELLCIYSNEQFLQSFENIYTYEGVAL